MIDIQVTGAEELRLRLTSMTDKMIVSLQRGMTTAMIELQAYVKNSKLSGQVLRVKTGNLRSSINQQVDVNGEVVTGSVGTNVIYGRVHEYGGNFTRFGKKAGDYTVHFPERSFLRSSLQDRRDIILATLENSIKEDLNA